MKAVKKKKQFTTATEAALRKPHKKRSRKALEKTLERLRERYKLTVELERQSLMQLLNI